MKASRTRKQDRLLRLYQRNHNRWCYALRVFWTLFGLGSVLLFLFHVLWGLGLMAASAVVIVIAWMRRDYWGDRSWGILYEGRDA